MQKLRTLLVLTALLLLSVSVKVDAQKLSAILVILKAESNRITALEKNGQTKLANQLRSEAETIRQKTINDFSDHFNYCPVYYVIDSNFTLLKTKQIEGILLDKDYKRVKPNLTNGDNFYLVTYFGAPSLTRTAKDGKTYQSANNYIGDGLVVLDADLLPVKKYPDFIFVAEPNKSPAVTHPKYNFDSKTFSVYYRGWAEILNKKLSRKIDRQNRKYGAW